MEIVIWGTRGSIASPGPDTAVYGGNTTCVEIRNGDDFLIVDAGTGIRVCGNNLLKTRGPQNNIPLFITHTHWDHIQGFPFFIPIFIPGNNVQIYGPHNHTQSLKDVMEAQMQFSYFPVNFAQLQANIEYESLSEMQPVQIGSIRVLPKYINHPVPTLGYRFEFEDEVIVFMTDCEPYRDILYNGECPAEEEREEFEEVQAAVAEQNQGLVDFAQGADVFVMDAQYTQEEYEDGKVGWGHTSMEDAISIAERANVRQLLLCHHDPDRKDEVIGRLVEVYRADLASRPESSIEFLDAAREQVVYSAKSTVK